jgi:hypothetical protein
MSEPRGGSAESGSLTRNNIEHHPRCVYRGGEASGTRTVSDPIGRGSSNS